MVDIQEKKAVRVRCAHEVGQLSKILAPLAEARVNVEATNAVTLNDEGYVTIVTDDNRKALDLWRKAGYVADEIDLIAVDLPNKPGELATIANRLGQAGINIHWAQSSVRSGAESGLVLLSTSDNRDAIRRIRV